MKIPRGTHFEFGHGPGFQRMFESIFGGETKSALMGKAGTALRARDQNDPRWQTLVERLMQTFDLTHAEVEVRIQAIARGQV